MRVLLLQVSHYIISYHIISYHIISDPKKCHYHYAWHAANYINHIVSIILYTIYINATTIPYYINHIICHYHYASKIDVHRSQWNSLCRWSCIDTRRWRPAADDWTRKDFLAHHKMEKKKDKKDNSYMLYDV